MAGLFCCSGDHINTATGGQKWDTHATIVPGGLHGRGLAGNWAKSLATIRSKRVSAGVWFRNSIRFGPTYPGALSHHGAVQSNGDGSFQYTILDGAGTLYLSAVDLWRPNVWHFLEMDLFLDTTEDGTEGGFIKVYLDDPLHLSPIIDLEDVYTVSSTYATGDYGWNGFACGSSSVFDDLLVLDGATTDVYGNTGAPVGPQGPIRIDVVRAMGVGFKAEFTPDPVVPNWQNVDEDSPDTTTVNTAGASGSPSQVGAEDLHEMEDIDTGDTAIFQHILCSANKSDEGVGQLTMLQRHDGTTYDLETRNLALTPFYRTRVMLHTMPNGDPLTDANFNAAQAGYRREA